MSYMDDFLHLQIQLDDIKAATNNFSDRPIGTGGFGAVYKGELLLPKGRRTVAFKRLDRKFGQGDVEFWKEITMLSELSHENLASLIHFCREGDERILVYEYASRRSLDRYLDKASLTWIQRLHICLGAARGIAYLHDPKKTQQRVVHRDIKSSNILLDDDWTAKVSDFGLSKITPANQPRTYLVSNAVGTPGYCDPAYHETGILSKECDVYSFGVVLFEVMCGRLCYEFDKDKLIRILVHTWKNCYDENRLDDIVFPDLKQQVNQESLSRFAAIAKRCLNRNYKERPNMDDVVKELEVALDHQQNPELNEAGVTKSYRGRFMEISLEDIQVATNNFSHEKLIGRVSSGREPDAETAQIKAAKQRSLGCSPSESLVEFLSLRYWSNNVVNYYEKVMDGFYDVYGIASSSVTQGKMPSLVDLQARTVYDDVDYEVILVDRRIDKELQHLEERVSNISLECQASGLSQIVRLIQRVANIVVAQMGGPVSDADEMLRRWTARSYELRNTLKTIVLPLGSIDCGLSRHRALLFKVLADKINLACSLVKGSYYTGTDDGAVNLIKIDNGSEYIIDLMGAPGTLIPVEVPCCNLQNIEVGGANFGYTLPLLDISSDPLIVTAGLDSLTKVDSSDLAVASIISSQLNSKSGNAVERNQTERFENDFGKLLPALVRSHEGLSGGGNGGRTSPAQNSQINDVSKCVINASKNPDFAQKLHAVLLKTGATSSDSLLNVNNKGVGMGETEAREIVHLLDADMLTFGDQHVPSLGMSSKEHCLISFTEAEISNVNDNYQPVVSGLPKNNSGYTLPSQIINEDAMNDYAVVKPMERQYEDGVAGGGPCLINETRTDNIKNSKNLDPSCSNHREGLSLDEVEWEIPWEDLHIGARIGIGSYGEVYRSEWNGTEVAVKKFMNQDISGDALTQFKGEIEIMLRLRHPNVVLFMGAVTRPPNLSILTEFLPRGSLFKLLHRSNVQLDERRRMRMALDVAKGMNYLHTSNPIIVHRDLKTPNLLVDKNWVVKVCDFGMSRMKHHTFLSSKSTAGTPEWMAPEVLRNEPSNEKCDVYSYGVILWELATLRIPWTEMNSMQVVGAVGFQFRHLDIPEHVDPAAARIISDCWHLEPQSRPSFKEIISRLRSLKRLSTDRTKNQ